MERKLRACFLAVLEDNHALRDGDRLWLQTDTKRIIIFLGNEPITGTTMFDRVMIEYKKGDYYARSSKMKALLTRLHAPAGYEVVLICRDWKYMRITITEEIIVRDVNGYGMPISEKMCLEIFDIILAKNPNIPITESR